MLEHSEENTDVVSGTLPAFRRTNARKGKKNSLNITTSCRYQNAACVTFELILCDKLCDSFAGTIGTPFCVDMILLVVCPLAGGKI